MQKESNFIKGGDCYKHAHKYTPPCQCSLPLLPFNKDSKDNQSAGQSKEIKLAETSKHTARSRGGGGWIWEMPQITAAQHTVADLLNGEGEREFNY